MRRQGLKPVTPDREPEKSLSPSVYPSIEVEDRWLVGHQDRYSETSTESLPWSVDYETEEQNWARRNGYVPSLDDRTLEIIHLILGRDMAKEMAKIKAADGKFSSRLSDERNVHLEEHPNSDPYKVKFNNFVASRPESKNLKNMKSEYWIADLNNCTGGNEAIFQRTVMMQFLDRHRLILSPAPNSGRSKLAFNVEAEWKCLPMPTRGAEAGNNDLMFLAAPKPDLCVSFQRDQLISDKLWGTMPSPMKQLVCYEGEELPQNKRAFGFFVIEAKNGRLTPRNPVSRNQVLNAASQALHNLFEFFREARLEEVFFDSVRFFSASASEIGVIFRIHRAVKTDPNDPHLRARSAIPATPPYELEFRFEELATFMDRDFTHPNVTEMAAKIMVGYGEGHLHGLIQAAATAIHERFQQGIRDGLDPKDMINDYRHGQTALPKTGGSKSVRGQGSPGTPTVSGRPSTRETPLEI